MKKTATFINVSRGGLVVQDDLVAALKEGSIRSAGLDVMTPEPLPPGHELARLPNATLTPHMASSATEVRMAMTRLAVDNVVAALEGEDMPKSVK